MTLEEVIHKLEADRTNLETRLSFYTSISPENWPNGLMGIMEGMLMTLQQVLYMLHQVNIGRKEQSGSL